MKVKILSVWSLSVSIVVVITSLPVLAGEKPSLWNSLKSGFTACAQMESSCFEDIGEAYFDELPHQIRKNTNSVARTVEVPFNRFFHPWLSRATRQVNEEAGEQYGYLFYHAAKITLPLAEHLQGPYNRFKSSFCTGTICAPLWSSVTDLPATVKIWGDHYASWSFGSLSQMTEAEQKKVPKKFRGNVKVLVDAIGIKAAEPYQIRARKILERLRPYSADAELRSCLRVEVTSSSVVNAFNTGCSIYLTTSVLDVLTDLELAAVVAHEMTHGDHGHYVKNIFLAIAEMGWTFTELMGSETKWLMTGAIDPEYAAVIDRGFAGLVDNWISNYSAFAVDQEIDADHGALRILNGAGISKRMLKRALMKLTSAASPVRAVEVPQGDDYTLAREYPSLQRRLDLIDSAQAW